MVIETSLDIGTMLQIDATIITGILILLTISNITKSEIIGAGISRKLRLGIFMVIIPFAGSASLLLITEFIGMITPSSPEIFEITQRHMMGLSLLLMGAGFVYIIFAIGIVTSKRKTTEK